MSRKPTAADAEPNVDATSTKTQLLDAAEGLFEERGIRGTSLRAITERANANIASVNYHFGSKRDLISAVLARRVDPLNAERLRLLDELEASSHFDLEQVFDALIAPALRQPERYPGLRLLARMHFEPDPAIYELVQQPFVEVQHRFLAALRAAAPDLSEASLKWRLSFAIGAMAATIVNLEKLRAGSIPLESTGQTKSDLEISIEPGAVTQQLTRFVTGGMVADEVGMLDPKRKTSHSQKGTSPSGAKR